MIQRGVLIILSTLLLCGAATGEQGKTARGSKFFQRVPSAFLPMVQALGNRVHGDAKHHIVYAGEFVDGFTGARSPAEVSFQVPGLVRLRGFKPGRGVLSFDGERLIGHSSRADEAMVETFLGDTIEGLVAALDDGAAVQFVGGGFVPDPRKTPNHRGPRYDIYEITAPVASRMDRLLRIKRYYFDSDTGLLLSTRYYDTTLSPGIKVETRFSSWQSSDGSQYPGRVERYEDGRLVFSFITAAVSAGPAKDTQTFR